MNAESLTGLVNVVPQCEDDDDECETERLPGYPSPTSRSLPLLMLVESRE